MESSPDMELINLAIHKLLEDKRNSKNSSSASVDNLLEEDDALLLSRLLSQLESLQKDSGLKQYEESTLAVAEAEAEATSLRVDKVAQKDENGLGEIGVEEIVKELKEVKKQNTRTHWLLSVMIAITVVWQVSEVSILLKLKNGLAHPFRSFGSMLVGMLPHSTTGTDMHQELDRKDNHHNHNHNNHNHHHLVDPSLPSVKMPDLPHLELPHLGSSSEDN